MPHDAGSSSSSSGDKHAGEQHHHHRHRSIAERFGAVVTRTPAAVVPSFARSHREHHHAHDAGATDAAHPQPESARHRLAAIAGQLASATSGAAQSLPQLPHRALRRSDWSHMPA